MHTLRQATLADVDAIYALVEARVHWMDDVGIKQWNVTDYLNAVPKSVYAGRIKAGQMYALLSDDGAIIAAAALLTHDDYWKHIGDANAMYIHSFVSSVTCPGAGAALLNQLEDLAAQRGAAVMRLDCASDNPKLNQWYEKRGYLPVGHCDDGPYHGTCRQKPLTTPLWTDTD